ncbi:MAG: hypothetical protein AAF547_25030 [Actinomycetota bacterium]
MGSSGYWPSPWPVECGGNHRQKAVPTLGLGLGPVDRLVATTRHTGRWPVMFIQRSPGELYLQGTTLGHEPRVAGWVERVDPVTLEPLASSGDLPAGAHEWCGSIAAHRNGDLYTVNGSYLHRLTPTCSVVSELPLPVDHAHNGLLVLDDGSIITKDLRIGDAPSTLTVCDPDLAVLTTVEVPEPSMGRLAAVGDEIYVVGSTRLFRYRWDGAALHRDVTWEPTYRHPDRGGLGWDTTIVDGWVWLMDNGDIPAVRTRFSQSPTVRSAGDRGPTPPAADWDEPVRAIGISAADDGNQLTIIPTEHPAGWVIAPPLVHGGVAVVWDTGGMGLAAFDLTGSRPGDMLWFQPFRPSMQPIVFPDTRELVINDFRLLDGTPSDDIVVLDLHTGQMKARVPTGSTRMNGMFLTPGFDRDLYYCSFDTVARIRAVSPEG